MLLYWSAKTDTGIKRSISEQQTRNGGFGGKEKRRKNVLRKEIIQQTKFKNGGMLSKLLEELDTSGFITTYGGFGKKTKESLYILQQAKN